MKVTKPKPYHNIKTPSDNRRWFGIFSYIYGYEPELICVFTDIVEAQIRYYNLIMSNNNNLISFTIKEI